MVRLDYELSARWNGLAVEVDLRSADETVLRYDCFLGDVVFVVDDVDLSARWGWVPVLDFALGLRAIAEGVVGGAEELFEFTDSEASIEFRRHGDLLTIEADYADAPVDGPYLEFSLEVERFLARVVADLVGRHRSG